MKKEPQLDSFRSFIAFPETVIGNGSSKIRHYAILTKVVL